MGATRLNLVSNEITRPAQGRLNGVLQGRSCRAVFRDVTLRLVRLLIYILPTLRCRCKQHSIYLIVTSREAPPYSLSATNLELLPVTRHSTYLASCQSCFVKYTLP